MAARVAGARMMVAGMVRMVRMMAGMVAGMVAGEQTGRCAQMQWRHARMRMQAGMAEAGRQAAGRPATGHHKRRGAMMMVRHGAEIDATAALLLLLRWRRCVRIATIGAAGTAAFGARLRRAAALAERR